MNKPISEFVGEVELKGDKGTEQAYRALRPVICAGCGHIIPEGTLFTRIVIPGSGVRISPRCQKCFPFTLRDGKETVAASPLMDNLLRGGESRRDTTQQKSTKEVEDAITLRLGPALERARRSSRAKD
ncbi:MAG: hypothetical protein H0U81_03450 [Pyrinomonadaceae bacterium]|nr:hypothetical protein [Pyrinomonadaceae bacterium]